MINIDVAEAFALLLPIVVVDLAFGYACVDAIRRRTAMTRPPRLIPRSLPAITDVTPANETRVEIAGRTYILVEAQDQNGLREPCPWCLGPLEPGEGQDVVRCAHLHCGRAGHRRHTEEFGGCGGVCSVLG